MKITYSFLTTITLTICIAPLLSSCSWFHKKTIEELYSEQKSGVVLIYNKFYYSARVNDIEVYFTGIENNNFTNLSADEADAKANAQVLNGTGFFIDENGTILTNRHVAYPALDEREIAETYKKLINSLRILYEFSMDQLSDQFDSLNEEKSTYYDYDQFGFEYCTNETRVQEIENEKDQLRSNYQDLKEKIETLPTHIMPSDIRIETVTEIGIAYNDTHVVNEDDLLRNNGCVITKVSKDKNVDLATIQLKNEKTPDDKYVFDLSYNDKIPQTQIGEPLYMIGYNAGLLLGTTSKGIQSQLNKGNISQEPDGERLLYSIPAIGGSSGSPVLNDKGQVIAVNFAKMNGTEMFTFGIPMNKVLYFLDR